MPEFHDITGQRFGRLIALEIARRNPTRWLCHCDCGNKTIVQLGHLTTGDTKSCGCQRGSPTHRRYKTRTYYIWAAMLRRCRNSKASNYKNYGGRSIKVCDRWMKFENFLADMGESPAKLSLDRINNDGNYEPGNCRWTTASEQAKNRRPEWRNRGRDPITGRFYGLP